MMENMENKKLTGMLLDMDPVAITEELTGTDASEWDASSDEAMTSLQVSQIVSATKRAHLEATGDTHLGTAWAKFLAIAEELGFKLGVKLYFLGSEMFKDRMYDEEVVLYHEKGIVIHAESYRKTGVNSAKMYLEVHFEGEHLSDSQVAAINGCSYCFIGDGKIQITVDIRQGFRYFFEKLLAAFEVVPQWTKLPFLWFLNYMESHEEHDDYEAITRNKLRLCCGEVQRIVGFPKSSNP